MPSLARTLLVAAPAAVLAVFLSMPFTVQTALAKPVPLAPARHALTTRDIKSSAEKSSRTRHSINQTVPKTVRHRRLPRDISALEVIDRRQDSLDALLDSLTGYYNGASQHATNYHNLAKTSTSQGSNSGFQQQTTNELSGFQTNVSGFQKVLADMGSDKGLANYDHTNQLEILMKDTVDLNKNVLSDTTTMVYQIPTLGPTLGPIVYELKCILDDMLDTTENMTDGIINALQPALQSVIGEAATATCASGVDVAGLCI